MRSAAPFVLLLATAPVLAQIPIRVGLSTQATEHLVSLEGGGDVLTRSGRALFTLKPGETLRIWWDSRGEADPADGYRVQVGPPVEVAAAEAVMAKLRLLGEQPERVRVSDGDTWRVLTGWFDQAGDAEPILRKLGGLGFEELWVSTEKRDRAPRQGRALYGITERYERRALPLEGVRFRPKGELTQVQGKGRYRGFVEILPNAQGRLTVVNEVELETYLRGVVPKEMGAWQFPALEALKAQAVAARTYAVANRGKRAKEGFDLLDTVADQVYGGRDGEQSLTDRAIEETRGLVATHNGRPIQALFMANSGGHTVDNRFVFGGGATPYLKSASNYLDQPTTLRFTGRYAPVREQAWLSSELLALAAVGAVPDGMLEGDRLAQPARGADLRAAVKTLTDRLRLPESAALPPDGGRGLLLWMARCFQMEAVVPGIERPQDARYFLGAPEVGEADLPLASFLVRRGVVPPPLWRTARPTLGQALGVLGRLWAELEPLEWSEGTLLRDGQVRVKNSGPGPLKLAPAPLVAEEAPGGHLRLVASTAAQVGDRLRWLSSEEGSRILVRRLDPDGSSMDRYNPTAHWREELKEADLLARLKARAGLGSLQSMDVVHNEHGRVLELIVKDGAGRPHRFTGMRIRLLLGLKDNVFRMIETGRRPDRRWIVYGRGWGHGVGMDQTGAYGYALEGWTFDRILKHYYQGIELTPVGR
ncbi:MAG TPA: SpoIID/LytB domain-containing protein [Holophaga sp.]|nr:SpoIID/LytB domain-containing protein [Holophaga sp.]